MKSVIAAIAAVVLFAGCASTSDYTAYAEIHKARASAEAARYAALADIAKQGDTTAKVAAVMSLQNAGAGANTQSGVAAPRSNADVMLQWAGILVPSLTQAYAIGQNATVQIEQGRNAMLSAQAGTNAFVQIAGKIQAPGAVNNTTLSGTGTLGSGTYSIDNSATATPTVVNQPAPLFVNQPAPLVVRPEIVNPLVLQSSSGITAQPDIQP